MRRYWPLWLLLLALPFRADATGTLAVPNTFGSLAAGAHNGSLIDDNFTSVENYVNNREGTADDLAGQHRVGHLPRGESDGDEQRGDAGQPVRPHGRRGGAPEPHGWLDRRADQPRDAYGQLRDDGGGRARHRRAGDGVVQHFPYLERDDALDGRLTRGREHRPGVA